MADPQNPHLEALRVLTDRSPEGLGVPLGTLEGAGVDQDSVRALEQEGYVEVIDDDGEPTLVITDSGRDLLRP